jgi:hypothetical protein
MANFYDKIQLFKTNLSLISALKIVFLVVGIVSAAVLAVVFAADKSWLLAHIPICEYKTAGKECVLCGSTRAFFEIRNGNFQQAAAYNRASIFLFGLMIMNVIITITATAKKFFTAAKK